MSANDRILFNFSMTFSIVMFALVVIPYLRGKRDLFTFWNMFLFGSGIFVGFSGLNSATREHFFLYSNAVFTHYYLGLAAFYIPLFFAYHFVKTPRRLASRWLTVWPKFDSGTLYFLTIVSLLLALGQLAISFVPGMRQIVIRIGAVAPSFALTFAMANWWLSRKDIIRIGLVLLVLAVAVYSGFSYGGGRRILYGTLGVIPMCIYWWKLREMKPWKVIALFAALIVPFVGFDQAYRAVRFHGVRWGTNAPLSRAEGAKTRFNMLKEALNSLQKVEFARVGQAGVEATLISINAHVVDPGSNPWATVKPFFSLYVAATMPIPRVMWPDKPLNLGLTLPVDCGVLEKGTKQNWGIGVVGHGYHDGGLPVLVIYGIMAAFMLRLLDELLIRNAGNPLFLGFVITASGHVILWPRGVLSQLSMQVIACFLVMLLIRALVHMFMGKQRMPQHVVHSVPVQQYHAQHHSGRSF